jgi:hypothetical protein
VFVDAHVAVAKFVVSKRTTAAGIRKRPDDALGKVNIGAIAVVFALAQAGVSDTRALGVALVVAFGITNRLALGTGWRGRVVTSQIVSNLQFCVDGTLVPIITHVAGFEMLVRMVFLMQGDLGNVEPEPDQSDQPNNHHQNNQGYEVTRRASVVTLEAYCFPDGTIASNRSGQRRGRTVSFSLGSSGASSSGTSLI